MTAAREKLMDTASRLFLLKGLPSVGVNEVTAAAGIARMTLYNNFPSKEALALAAYGREAERRRAMVEARLAQADTPSDQLAAMFAVAAALASNTEFRGCAFINLAAQEANPAGALHALARAHKDWLRARFAAIAISFGRDDHQALATQWLALWDGAIAAAYIGQDPAPIALAAHAARVLANAGRGQ